MAGALKIYTATGWKKSGPGGGSGTGPHTLESHTNVDSTAPSEGDSFVFEAGSWQHRQLTKADVGLSNVDNTADVDKPVSTAVQSALDSKGNVTRVVYTGAPPARPAGATYVEWVGPQDPDTLAIPGDTWIPTA